MNLIQNLQFGKIFSNHMLEVDWDIKTGWKKPIIKPYENISINMERIYLLPT